MTNTHVITGPLCVAQVLSAIVKIKVQKQRPNLDRVVTIIRQRNKENSCEVIRQFVDKCVSDGTVITTMSKGQITYKDPNAKPNGTSAVKRKANSLDRRAMSNIQADTSSPVPKTPKPSAFFDTLLCAVRDLSEEPAGNCRGQQPGSGVSFAAIETYIREKHNLVGDLDAEGRGVALRIRIDIRDAVSKGLLTKVLNLLLDK